MSRLAAVKVLAALIALQVGLGAIGVATVEEQLPSQGVLTKDRATHPGVTPSSEAVRGPDEAAPEGGDPAASKTPGAGPAESDNPAGTIPAPRPGTYRYTQTSKTRSEFSTTTFSDEKTEEVERRIERVSEKPGEIVDRRHIPNRVTSSGDDGSKSESRSYEERVWRAEGSLLRTEVHFSSNTSSDGTREERRSECDWEPDRVQLAFPLEVGREWSWESTCTHRSEEGEATTTNKGSGRVTGTRDLSIGGRSVPTFVIELNAVEDSSGTHRPEGGSQEYRFQLRSEQKTKSFFAASLGLPARVEAEHKQDSTFEGGAQTGPQRSTSTQTATSELLNVDPA